jgi:hypothetical protein
MTRDKPVPPEANQFQPGRSGNPRGRPRKAKSDLAGILRDALEARTEQGGKRMTKLEAAVRKIADSAAAGDPKMLQMLLAELRRIDGGAEPHDCMDVVRAQMENAHEEFMARLQKLRDDHERQEQAKEEPSGPAARDGQA